MEPKTNKLYLALNFITHTTLCQRITSSRRSVGIFQHGGYCSRRKEPGMNQRDCFLFCT